MPAKLTLRVPLMPDELATDYCSRLALRNFRSASQFALDMGFRFPHLVSGSDAALSQLAEVSGEPLGSLDENRLRWTKTDRYRLKGQVLARQTLRLGHFFGCPECFNEDINTSDMPAVAAVRPRMHWMLASVQTCDKHHIVLQNIGDRYNGSMRRNWSDIADSIVQRLPALAATAVSRSPSKFEIYLLNRLYGTPTRSWLDQLDFFAAEHTARIFGAVAKPDLKTDLDRLSESELHEVGRAGFEIVNGGQETIFPFLLDLQRSYKREAKRLRVWEIGPVMVYGRMYSSLKRLENDPAFLPVRQTVADHVLAHFPLGSGDTVFGRTLDARRFHSVLTAAKQFKIRPSRVLGILTAGGLLPRPGWKDHEAVVDALEAETLIRQQMESVTQAQAQQHLNVSTKVMDGLIDYNVIRRHKQSMGLQAHRFLVSDLDDLLTGLFSEAVAIDPDTNGVVPLNKAANRVKSSVHAIVTLIIKRRLKCVRYRPDFRGFASLLVDPEEVAGVLKQSHPRLLNTSATASKLKLSQRAVRHLVRQDLLVGSWMKHPVTHKRRLFFEPSDVDRFEEEYVSLYNLSRSTGRQSAELKKAFAERTILPVVEENRVTTIYRRADLV
ncbi:TniQ family protein [Tardiphaga sp. 866_E4_N2_1]|uniref:TniQ family protein n=1 Tax=unclassified Tardiphaga TaxID=2631404 RepID=UPI003F1FC6A8